MADDRNLIVNTHNEALAIEIYNRIKPYASLMEIGSINYSGGPKQQTSLIKNKKASLF